MQQSQEVKPLPFDSIIVKERDLELQIEQDLEIEDEYESDLDEMLLYNPELFKMLINSLKLSTKRLIAEQEECDPDLTWIINLEAGLEVLEKIDLEADLSTDQQISIINDYRDACASSLDTETFYMVSFMDPDLGEMRHIELTEEEVDTLHTLEYEDVLSFIRGLEDRDDIGDFPIETPEGTVALYSGKWSNPNEVC